MEPGALAPVHPHHAALVDRERELAVLELECRLAEQFAPPAMQGADLGLIAGRDLLEVVDGGDHLAGDAVALRRHAEQHLQQLDGRRPVGIVSGFFQLGERRRVAGQPALHGGDDVG
ncbi:hypothetical protein chiPu_0028395, partial [Chiloscyllium punctatum]|nr:hypothetical protein [Chiloscyllium punctatum]